MPISCKICNEEVVQTFNEDGDMFVECKKCSGELAKLKANIEEIHKEVRGIYDNLSKTEDIKVSIKVRDEFDSVMSHIR